MRGTATGTCPDGHRREVLADGMLEAQVGDRPIGDVRHAPELQPCAHPTIGGIERSKLVDVYPPAAMPHDRVGRRAVIGGPVRAHQPR